ncbi:hypothetical protein GLAREA_00721 [Glarea lozoyensis ATCC 20868]|uniref:Heat shock factor-binding protein 1 n=2 Tax=Glarea lozoyensis TaxID=101852 RepID=S3DC36_GLAL2|nr:uncharacterized protein GLAREA_00721 [Glarea lozoyensis ATCC 20868]EHL03664.1 putative Heat shock factor-binding protein 1 [Glarea lozoyensis 74030]EPE29561.1 hypothetical protein GLAREA_00721 [Glarea lozoyensis ATCC 20868]
MASNLNGAQPNSSPGDQNRMSTNSSTADTSATAVPELTAVIDDLLNQLSNKFAGASSEIFAKLDEMSRRLDTLEQSMQASNESAGSRDGKTSPTKS